MDTDEPKATAKTKSVRTILPLPLYKTLAKQAIEMDVATNDLLVRAVEQLLLSLPPVG